MPYRINENTGYRERIKGYKRAVRNERRVTKRCPTRRSNPIKKNERKVAAVRQPIIKE